MTVEYEKYFNRVKKGENYVEVAGHLSEKKRLEIEQYMREHLNTNTEWLNWRFCEKISLDQIVALLEGIPDTKECLTVLSVGTIIDYPIAKDPEQNFRNIILDQVPHEQVDGKIVFKKSDVIYWMEKKAKQDKQFIYRLNEDFVIDYKQLHPDSNENVSKDEFFRSLLESIIEDAKESGLEKILNMPFCVRACLAFCGFELCKDRKIYNKEGDTIKNLSYDTLSRYFQGIKILKEKPGNKTTVEKDDLEKCLNDLKKRFDLEKYNIHKRRLNKLMKQKVFI